MKISFNTPLTFAALVSIQAGCGSPGITEHDLAPPTISLEVFDPIIVPTQNLVFTITAADNVTLGEVGWTMTGVITKDSSIRFTSTTANYSQQFVITETLTPGSVLIVATAADLSGGVAPDSAVVTVIPNSQR